MQRTSVQAWDWPTRAFHWTLVFCIASAWVSFRFSSAIGDPTLRWHRWNGYAILVLIVFRLLWGFVGSSTSRFAAFFPSPFKSLRYAAGMLRGAKEPYLGHNPLGSWMIFALLAGVAVQAGLGLFSLEHNEIVAGPLKRLVSHETSEAITKWHVWGFNLLLALIAAHLTANILYGFVKKDPLIRAMVTGRKPAEAYVDQSEATLVPRVGIRALVCLIASIAIVFGGITLAGGRVF
jgi:cytochrome b